MRNFLRHLRAAWLFGRFFPYVDEADADDFWTPDDEQYAGQFFKSYTGKKLMLRLKNYATNSALDAVRKPNDPQYRNGVAGGVSMTVAAIESHLPAQQPLSQDEAAEMIEQEL